MGRTFRFKIDDAPLRSFEEEVLDNLHAQVNGKFRVVIDKVTDEYAGEPAGEVYAKLIAELAHADLKSRRRDEPGLRRIATDIVRGTLAE